MEGGKQKVTTGPWLNYESVTTIVFSLPTTLSATDWVGFLVNDYNEKHEGSYFYPFSKVNEHHYQTESATRDVFYDQDTKKYSFKYSYSD